jgi:hypothetical protein
MINLKLGGLNFRKEGSIIASLLLTKLALCTPITLMSTSKWNSIIIESKMMEVLISSYV